MTEVVPAAAEVVPDSEDDKIKAEYRAIAERRVRLGLLLSEVGRANAITVTQDELNQRLDQTFAAKTRGDLNAVFTDLPSATWRDATAGGARATAGSPASSAYARTDLSTESLLESFAMAAPAYNPCLSKRR